jgi:CDP-paratose 2-epimerase
LTGPQHAAVELHGFLAYIAFCACTGKEYTIFGYKGKQVRDQIHCADVAALFLEFFNAPRAGEAYNLGGGRGNSLSVLETIAILKEMGHPLKYSMRDENRMGDHICYISDLTKVKSHFPSWTVTHHITDILGEMVARHAEAAIAETRT